MGSFSARRSLDKLLSFSRLNSMQKKNENISAQSMNGSFLNIANPQKNSNSNVTVVPQSRSQSLDGDEQPGKARKCQGNVLDKADENGEEESKENDENVNTQNIANAEQNNQILNQDEEENAEEEAEDIENISNAKRNRSKWNKEQIKNEGNESNENVNVAN